MIQKIHTSSHGEIEKHSSGDILMVKWFYLPTIAVSLAALSDNWDLSYLLSPSASESIVSASVVSGWWRFGFL